MARTFVGEPDARKVMPPNVSFVEDVSSEALASAYADLMAVAFGGPAAQWRRTFTTKHVDNPFGGSYATLVIESGKLVAMNMFWKWRFSRGGDTVRAAQSCDSVVHPSWQGRGIFAAMQSVALEKIPADELCYGFPQENSAPGLRKVGFAYFKDYRRRTFVVDVRRFVFGRAVPRRHEFRLMKPDVRVRPGVAEVDTLFALAKRDTDVWMTDYSCRLIEWRMELNESIQTALLEVNSRVVGCLVYTLSELAIDPTYRLLSVIDLVYLRDAHSEAAVAQWLRRIMDQHGVSEMRSMSTKPFHVLAKIGWLVQSRPGGLFVHPAHRRPGGPSVEEFVACARITVFDSDHV